MYRTLERKRVREGGGLGPLGVVLVGGGLCWSWSTTDIACLGASPLFEHT